MSEKHIGKHEVKDCPCVNCRILRLERQIEKLEEWKKNHSASTVAHRI